MSLSLINIVRDLMCNVVYSQYSSLSVGNIITAGPDRDVRGKSSGPSRSDLDGG